MSVIIKKGETKPITFEIEEEDNMFSDEDILLFAIKNIDGNIIFTEQKSILEIPASDNIYLYTVELKSSFTNNLIPNSACYFFDLTLLRGDKKTPLSDVLTIEVEDTVGASIEV